MSYTTSSYIYVNGKKFYAGTACGDGSINSGDKALAYKIGNATYYVPMTPGQASGLNVNVGGSIYHACNAQPYLCVHGQVKTLCNYSMINLCTCTTVQVATIIPFSGGFKRQSLSCFMQTTWQYLYNCCNIGYAHLQTSDGVSYASCTRCERAWSICDCYHTNKLTICGPNSTVLCTLYLPYGTTKGDICSWTRCFALSVW